MIRALARLCLWGSVVCGPAAAWALEPVPTAGAAAGATPEILESEPVGQLLPARTPTPAPTPSQVGSEPSEVPAGRTVTSEFGRTRLLLPYYFGAYPAVKDRTEVDLGLILTQTPGVAVALGWGALEELTISARMAALGASSLVGLNFRYLVMAETPDSSKPAFSLTFLGMYSNLRTLGEVRENIFRGNRLQVGAALSKDLGVLARYLEAGQGLQGFLDHFRLHAEAVGGLATGRSGAAEDPLTQAEFGVRAALEIILDPNQVHLFLALDTLPAWEGETNYYLALRYFTQPDLAFDVLGGRLENNYGLQAGLAWIF